MIANAKYELIISLYTLCANLKMKVIIWSTHSSAICSNISVQMHSKLFTQISVAKITISCQVINNACFKKHSAPDISVHFYPASHLRLIYSTDASRL